MMPVLTHGFPIKTLKQRVVIVWKEFDGEQTSLHTKVSLDRGKSWINKTTGLISKSKNSHPKLITNNSDIFLSWMTKDNGQQVITLILLIFSFSSKKSSTRSTTYTVVDQ